MTVPTFTATIYVGFSGTSDDTFWLYRAHALCRAYCDEIGLCVTVTPTRFVYTDGGEDGCAVGLINYPRFPSTREQIKERALVLAERLRVEFVQKRVSVVFTDETVTLGDMDA
jgi:hypothetical protein